MRLRYLTTVLNLLFSAHGLHSQCCGRLCSKNLEEIFIFFAFKFLLEHTTIGRYISKPETGFQKRSFYWVSLASRTSWKLPCPPWVDHGFQAYCPDWCENSSSGAKSGWYTLLPWTSLQILTVWSWIAASCAVVFSRSKPAQAKTSSLRL
jgi:hypothetical protein